MISYYVISMIVSHSIFNMVSHSLQDKIVYGGLSQDLLKPMPILSQYFSRQVANRVFALFTEVIPVFIISILLFNITVPDVPVMLLFMLSLVLAFLLNFLFGFLLGTLAFWIHKIEAVEWLLFIIIRFLSGEFIPLDFFGSTLLAVSRFLPFYYIRYGVIQIYLERGDALQVISGQLIWIFIMYVTGKMLWETAIRKFGAMGG